MKLGRIAYRVGQFREAIWAVPDPADLELAQTCLNPAQMELFSRMQASDQAHSIQVFKQLACEPLTHEPLITENNRDLLVAALLHDVGKSCYPISPWERVVVVLLKLLFPRQFKRWGMETPDRNGILQSPTWRRLFIIAEQHPRWGAEMASAAGTSPLATSLILRHQNKISADPATLEDRLLKCLQAADGAY